MKKQNLTKIQLRTNFQKIQNFLENQHKLVNFGEILVQKNDRIVLIDCILSGLGIYG